MPGSRLTGLPTPVSRIPVLRWRLASSRRPLFGVRLLFERRGATESDAFNRSNVSVASRTIRRRIVAAGSTSWMRPTASPTNMLAPLRSAAGFGAEGVVAEVGAQLVLVPVPPVEEVVAQQSPVIGRSNPFAESIGCDPETNTKYAHGPRKCLVQPFDAAQAWTRNESRREGVSRSWPCSAGMDWYSQAFPEAWWQP